MSSASFVGRVREIAALEQALGEGRRLLTVWGAAGIGKTRLSRQLLERRPGDGWFCDLTAATDASDIFAALARDLRVTREELSAVSSDLVAPGEHVEADELALVLAARGEMLIVLDNFEQVSAYAPQTLGRFVGAAPEARFVVTSRERLRLSAEIAFELAPLSVDGGDGDDGASNEAVTLLLERVRAAQPSYQPSSEDLERLAEIARVLEGIPLALELAAARVEMLGAAGVLARLRDDQAAAPQLDLLRRGRRDAPDRQATLRRAIEWSWSLLGEGERAALSRLAVFRGGFSAAAAEAVLDELCDDAASSGPLEVLSSLRDKSLLRARQSEGGASELRLYESVRELCAEQLATSGAAAAAEAKHAQFYLGCARSVLAGETQLPSYELANLLVVVQRLLARTPLDAQAAAELLTCLLAVDRARGSSAGHLELLERGVNACADIEGAERTLLARALRARGKARQLRGRLAAALGDLDAALELARQAGALALEGDLLADIGVVHHQRRAVDEAAARYDAALARYRELGDRRAEARVQANLAALHHDQRRFEQAARDYQRALTIFAEVGDLRLSGVHRTNLGILEQERGALGEAEACFERALAILHSLGDARYEAIARSNLGVLRHEQGRLDEARSCHETALRMLAEVGDIKSEALCQCRLAMVSAEEDEVEAAAHHVRAAEALFAGLGTTVEQAVGALARGFIELGEARRATARGDAEAARAQLSRVRERIGRALAPSGGERSPAELSDDVRSSVRLLERAIATFERSAGAPSAPPPAAAASADPSSGGESASLRADALVVGPEARWFRPPGGSWQDFRQRRSMRLILLHLVEQHRAAPGRGADIDALLAAGWPGERVSPDAASNRVYVALAGLRKVGLKPYLLRQDDGYLIDPALTVQWTAREPSS